MLRILSHLSFKLACHQGLIVLEQEHLIEYHIEAACLTIDSRPINELTYMAA